jgi:hypothetical protein
LCDHGPQLAGQTILGDVRDGKFVLPIGRRMPLRDAAEAHVLGEKGGIGKILLLAPNSQH